MVQLDLNAIPLFDHHCHTLVAPEAKADVERLIRVTSEAPVGYPLKDLVETVTFEAVKKVVGEITGTAVRGPADLGQIFSDIEYETYCRTLFQKNNYQFLLVDTGFEPEPPMELASLRDVTGTIVHPVLRLERLAQELRKPGLSFGEWFQKFTASVSRARQDGYIGAKSIAAYRSGLAIRPVTSAEAKFAYERWCEKESPRLEEGALINFILWETAPLLIEQGLPLQFHTGYGDPDTDLLKGNPLLLRDFIEAFSPRGLVITLLHTYPYHREAGYLASVYPGVYFDISLIIPLGASSARRVLAEALELAPMSRLLFASDAHTRPEMFALAAMLFRDALRTHFEDPTVSRFVSGEKLEQWSYMIMNGNAREVYFGR
ncbi:amidohydrolase family protein [Alicyclobacillus sp.]|uniref:amidohydrolase family protein n=1 Tax=Alicyclobacillus sp. TaxID=61169 RepID=UPI0025BC0FD3|nr:amidohydrolase family protein [Alicyclobacillus sp.]MCL6516926.1 amidohydrolase family protein [Alicyclobacillus sp.]